MISNWPPSRLQALIPAWPPGGSSSTSDYRRSAASNGSAVAAVAAVLGPQPALKAACVAGAFEIYNRVVDATGLPTGPAMRRDLASIIDVLGLDGFPHAGH